MLHVMLILSRLSAEVFTVGLLLDVIVFTHFTTMFLIYILATSNIEIRYIILLCIVDITLNSYITPVVTYFIGW